MCGSLGYRLEGERVRHAEDEGGCIVGDGD